MFTYNVTPHTATGYTPFELMYGHRASLPTALTVSPKPYYTYDNYAQEGTAPSHTETGEGTHPRGETKSEKLCRQKC
ncbi:hypothetical protein P5V15_008342 [Pogonomyrmex californicus]